jgi:hypothetical protein
MASEKLKLSKQRRKRYFIFMLCITFCLLGSTLAGTAGTKVNRIFSTSINNSGSASNLALSTTSVSVSQGNQYYVAPNGLPEGDGTLDNPWDLATALAQPSVVQPGDTIWLRDGVYTGSFVSMLKGTAEAPILVRQYPGERAIIDTAVASVDQLPALKVKGSWVWFWGFEIMNSYPDRSRIDPYTGNDEPWRGSGADVYASNVKFINMVFHDNGHGIWDKKDMTEIYGCLFYFNGNNKREHALYLGNTVGTKYIVDNIMFAQGGYGILGFSGAAPNTLNGFHIEGNVAFNNGILTLDDSTTGNIQVGGGMGVSVERLVVRDNYVYNTTSNAISKNCGIRLGYEDTANKDLQLLNNYIVSKVPLRVWWWQNIEAQGNTIYSKNYSTDLKIPSGVDPSVYYWDSNTYLSARKSGPIFLKDDVTYTFSSWKDATGLDRNSQVTQDASLRPTGVKTFLRPNRYEPKRGHLVVYNWDLRNWITVDLSSLGLEIGDTYSIYDVQNYFGGPVAQGTYDGYEVYLPLNLRETSQPIGNVERIPSHTAPEFAVFLVKEGM